MRKKFLIRILPYTIIFIFFNLNSTFFFKTFSQRYFSSIPQIILMFIKNIHNCIYVELSKKKKNVSFSVHGTRVNDF